MRRTGSDDDGPPDLPRPPAARSPPFLAVDAPTDRAPEMTQMMAERTPLAVLASALSHDQAAAAPAAGTHFSAADWSKNNSKRKRTVACGTCDACCRDDCGACLNCLDKPKFGGSGTRPRPPRRPPATLAAPRRTRSHKEEVNGRGLCAQ